MVLAAFGCWPWRALRCWPWLALGACLGWLGCWSWLALGTGAWLALLIYYMNVIVSTSASTSTSTFSLEKKHPHQHHGQHHVPILLKGLHFFRTHFGDLCVRSLLQQITLPIFDHSVMCLSMRELNAQCDMMTVVCSLLVCWKDAF